MLITDYSEITRIEYLLEQQMDNFLYIIEIKVQVIELCSFSFQKLYFIGSQWDLKQCIHQIPVATSAIQCFCIVDDFLWMGIQKSCVLINTSSLQLEVIKLVMIFAVLFLSIAWC